LEKVGKLLEKVGKLLEKVGMKSSFSFFFSASRPKEYDD
jgi:hypothetical protein